MSSKEAHSLLLLENNQAELTPLEKGKHAYNHIQRFDHKGGRGHEGGIREYARIHNYSNHMVVIKWIKAYEVFLKTGNLVSSLSPTILYEISKAPEPAWCSLCQLALDEGWTVPSTYLGSCCILIVIPSRTEARHGR